MIAASDIQLLPRLIAETPSVPSPVSRPEPELSAVIHRARSGDVEAFAEMVGRFEQRVFHFVLRMVGNPHDAEDVTQDSFVKVWRHFARFRPENNFSTWLFTIARRTALNHLRARRPTQELTPFDEPTHPGPDQTVRDREHAEAVWTLARRLKPDQYEVLWLRYGEGFSVAETARIMGTNSLRVRVLLHRARKRMAEWLKNKTPWEGGPR